jgi:O-antigen ligase/tetratricopeptide (TPR) repeat protein
MGSMKKQKGAQRIELKRSGSMAKQGSEGLMRRLKLLPEEIILSILFFGLMLVFSSSLHMSFTLPKLVVLRLGTLGLMILWCYRLKKGQLHNMPQVAVYALSALAAWWILSTAMFAIHVPTALHGVYGRFNGLWTHLLCIILFAAIATLPLETVNVERLLKIFSVILMPVLAYAILQYFELDPFDLPKRDFRPISLVGNAGSLAAILGLFLPFQTAFMLKAENRKDRLTWACIATVTGLGIFLTFSRAVLLASGIALVMVLIPYFKTKGVKAGKMIAWTAALICVGIAAIGAISLSRPGSEALSRFRLDILQQHYQVRLMNQRVALDIVRKSTVTGIGFENFRNVYPAYRPEQEALMAEDVTPTMVHNSYLDMLVDNGIPGLVLYICFVASCVFVLLKSYRSTRDRGVALLTLAFLASVSGYLIQDFFGWSEVSLMAPYWILLGMGVGVAAGVSGRPLISGTTKKMAWVFGVASCLVAVVLAALSFSHLRVDRLLQETFPKTVTEDWPQLQRNLSEMISLDPDNTYVLDGAGVKLYQRFALTGQTEYYRFSSTLLQKAHELNRLDPYILIHAVEVESTALEKGTIPVPSEFSQRAIKIALGMDPNNPTMYRAGAQFYAAQKDFTEAMRLIRRAKELRPDNLDGYIIERDILAATASAPRAIEEYRKAIEKSGVGHEKDRNWLRAKQSLAWLLLEDGKPQQALIEIADVIKAWPDQSTAFVIQGAAYIEAKEVAAAKASFEKALQLDSRNPHAISALQQLGVSVRAPAMPARAP